MKLYQSASEIYTDLKGEKITFEESQKHPYMLVAWNICYQLARIADKLLHSQI